MPSTHSRFGPKNTGRSDVAVFNTISEPLEETVYHYLESSPSNINALAQMVDEDGRTIKRSRVYDDQTTIELKSDSVLFGGSSENYISMLNGSIIGRNIEVEEVKFKDSSNSFIKSEFDVEAYIPDGKLVVTSAGGIESMAGINCSTLTSADGPLIGPSTLNNYKLPTTRGTSGQVIQAGSGNSTAWTTLTRLLPSAIATSANQTLLSTDAVGGLAWTPVVSLRAYRSTETIPPTGVSITLAAGTSTDILQNIGLNVFSPSGPVSNNPNGITYTGAFTRTFFCSISFDVITATNDQPTITFSLENVQSPSVIYGIKFVQIQKDVFRNIDLAGVSTLPTNGQISLRALSTIAQTIRIHNANVSFIMM